MAAALETALAPQTPTSREIAGVPQAAVVEPAPTATEVVPELALTVTSSAPSQDASAAVSLEETTAAQEAAIVELTPAAAEVPQEVVVAVTPSAPSEDRSAAVSIEETTATQEATQAAAVVELIPTATEVTQEEALAVMPSALSQEASAAIATEIAAAAEKPELSPLARPTSSDPHAVRDPSQNVIALVHDELVPMTEPKTVADGDGEGHERARVA